MIPNGEVSSLFTSVSSQGLEALQSQSNSRICGSDVVPRRLGKRNMYDVILPRMVELPSKGKSARGWTVIPPARKKSHRVFDM